MHIHKVFFIHASINSYSSVCLMHKMIGFISHWMLRCDALLPFAKELVHSVWIWRSSDFKIHSNLHRKALHHSVECNHPLIARCVLLHARTLNAFSQADLNSLWSHLHKREWLWLPPTVCCSAVASLSLPQCHCELQRRVAKETHQKLYTYAECAPTHTYVHERGLPHKTPSMHIAYSTTLLLKA